METQSYILKLVSRHENWTLTAGKHLIGRSRLCEIALPNDPRVSKRHAEIALRGREVTITDLSSRNGTFVDGKRVSDSAAIPSGAKLTIGRNEFTVAVEAWTGAPPPSKGSTVPHAPDAAAEDDWYREMLAKLPPSGEVSDELQALLKPGATLNPQRTEKVAAWAIVLASSTYHGKWLDTAWTLYHQQSVLVPPEQLKTVERVIESVRGARPEPLERYIAGFVAPQAERSAAAQALLGRLKNVHELLLSRTFVVG